MYRRNGHNFKLVIVQTGPYCFVDISMFYMLNLDKLDVMYSKQRAVNEKTIMHLSKYIASDYNSSTLK